MSKTASSEFKEDCDQMIREAEIMLRGTDAAQRERGLQELRKVIRLCEGSIVAQQASQLLIAAEPRLPAQIDPEVDELANLWPSIQKFNDNRLIDFLRRLDSATGVTVPLKREVARSLQKWIVEELPGIGVTSDPTRIAILTEFVVSVRGMSVVEDLPEFSQLHDKLFQVRLQHASTLIDDALTAWHVQEAQQVLGELKPVPDSFRPDVDRLKIDIDETDAAERTLDGLLAEFQDRPPHDWSEARSYTALQQQLARYHEDTRVPQDWRLRLDQTLKALTETINEFVHNHAQAAVSVQQLRDFWSEFDQLRGVNPDGTPEIDEHWFAEAQESLSAIAWRYTERAANVDELSEVASSLREKVEGVPPPLASWAQQRADELNQVAASWRQMEKGESFELGDGPLPKVLSSESKRYVEWAEQVESALESYNGETSGLTKDHYENDVRLARRILSEVPHHVLAAKLQHEATLRLVSFQLDQALLNWKVEEFFELLRAGSPGEIYSALASHETLLVELRELAKDPPLTNWHGAGAWWQHWDARIRRLPWIKPDALLTALDEQARTRRLERYETLSRLLRDQVTTREYEDAAAALDAELDLNLRNYRQELLRKATIVRLETYINEGQLEQAEQELRDLPSTNPDVVRVRTHLQFEQSRRKGVVATADYLFDDWDNAKLYLDHFEQHVIDTTSDVWSKQRADAVRKMERLISRLLRDTSQLSPQLEDWQKWLEIEPRLVQNLSLIAVKQLANYISSAECGELLDMRLQRLLESWQANHDLVMLAWSYQAFQHVSTVANRLDTVTDDLASESNKVAADVESRLAGNEVLELNELKDLQADISKQEQYWRSLNDYLNALRHPVSRPTPPPTLKEAKDRLVKVLRIHSSLDQLTKVDLRNRTAHQDYEDTYSRALQLHGVGSKSQLLEQLERLRPLQGDLFSLEQRIRETAQLCRSKQPLHVLEPGLFQKLANYVRKAVEIFESAEMRGGPMWILVSAEYQSKIFSGAGVLIPEVHGSDLAQLAGILDKLHREEVRFCDALRSLEDRDLQPKVAWSGSFDPLPHLDYLALIPKQAPSTLKVYYRFERARRDTFKLILEAPASRPYLPVWVHNYLDSGVPQ